MTISTLLPTILSYGFELIKMRKTAEGIKANPKATNGAGITTVVAFICLFAEHFGVEITPKMQESLVQVVAGIGVLYTGWRFER